MALCICLSMPKNSANKTLSYLLKRDIVRKDLKISYDGKYVNIPVKKNVQVDGAEMRELDFKERNIPYSPSGKVNELLKEMGSKEVFPDKFIKFGNSLVIKESRLPKFPLETLAMVADVFNVNAIYVDRGIGYSPLRDPDVRLIWGHSGDVTHEENGVFYTFDPEKVMFSPGNVNVRIEESDDNLNGKNVVDMFAGIGYFSLQLAKGSPGARVYSCELNPVSFSYLAKNIRRNKLENRIIALPGDCRVTTKGLSADYVIMGHFDTLNFLATALRICHVGSILNVHLLCDSGAIDTCWAAVRERAGQLGYTLRFKNQRIVKSYGPHLWHVSIRLRVESTI